MICEEITIGIDVETIQFYTIRYESDYDEQEEAENSRLIAVYGFE